MWNYSETGLSLWFNLTEQLPTVLALKIHIQS